MNMKILPPQNTDKHKIFLFARKWVRSINRNQNNKLHIYKKNNNRKTIDRGELFLAKRILRKNRSYKKHAKIAHKNVTFFDVNDRCRKQQTKQPTNKNA